KLFFVLACLVMPLALAEGNASPASRVFGSPFGQFAPDGITCYPGDITLDSPPTIIAPPNAATYPGLRITSTPGNWSVCGGASRHPYTDMYIEWLRDNVVFSSNVIHVNGPTLPNFTYTIQSADVNHALTSAVSPCNDDVGCYS